MLSRRFLFALIFTISAFFFSGCATASKTITKGEAYPKMYAEQPRSLLILPPINESTDAEAKDYYMTTIEMPFALMGYYIFPTEMVSDIMKQEGIYDSELLYNMPLSQFNDYFGADAVLFTNIKKWHVSYAVVASSLTISIEAKIVSTKTSEELWRYTGTVVVDLGGGNNSGGSLIGLLVQVAATAISTASADYVSYARVANNKIISTLPVGPYDEYYMNDQSMELFNQARRR